MLYEKMLAESARLDQRLQAIKKELLNYPEGKLICNQNGKYHKYYCKSNHELQYLHKNEYDLVEKLAIKKYLTYQYMDLLHEKKAIDFYINRHNSYHEKTPDILKESAGYRKFLLHYLSPPIDVSSFQTTSIYESNPNHPEQLVHKTLSGHVVRSKSESLIDTSLFMSIIPFQYECALLLGDICFYPDFTILHPETGNHVYWEHFGMMDNPTYAKNVYSKLEFYQKYNIIPSINLITTYETKEHPLTSDEIERTIAHYLL